MNTSDEIIETMRLCGHGSTSYLQNKLKISFDAAKKICDGLVFDKKENIYLTRMNDYLEKLNEQV